MSGQTNSLLCPQCGKEIEPSFIKKNLDIKAYEKFLEFSIRSFEGIIKDEKSVSCPSKGREGKDGNVNKKKRGKVVKINE